MSARLEITEDNLQSLSDKISELAKLELMVGIPEGKAERDPDGSGVYINNPTIAYINTTGDPAMHIPPRPFLVPGIEHSKDEVTKQLEAAANRVVNASSKDEGRKSAKIVLDKLGLKLVNVVRRYITTAPFPPLSPVTIAERLKKGHTGIKPLIETGQLRRSVSYILRKR